MNPSPSLRGRLRSSPRGPWPVSSLQRGPAAPKSQTRVCPSPAPCDASFRHPPPNWASKQGSVWYDHGPRVRPARVLGSACRSPLLPSPWPRWRERSPRGQVLPEAAALVAETARIRLELTGGRTPEPGREPDLLGDGHCASVGVRGQGWMMDGGGGAGHGGEVWGTEPQVSGLSEPRRVRGFCDPAPESGLNSAQGSRAASRAGDTAARCPGPPPGRQTGHLCHGLRLFSPLEW